MEESIAGFKVTGSWADIVEHGDRITYALREVGADRRDEDHGDYAKAFDEWDDWRPKSDERMRKEVAEKTSEQASVGEGEGEKAGKGPGEDIKSAGDKLAESYERLEESPTEAVDKWGESIDYVARAADSAGRKALRKVEDAVYRRVMTTISPYYFDNELISANLDRKRGTNEPTYVFEVNVNDDELKEAVAERLEAYERDYNRWHVDTPKRTDITEAAEGVEVPEAERNALDGDDT
ncbi:MAG: DUF5828 family protein [Halobacteriota archaeon]